MPTVVLVLALLAGSTPAPLRAQSEAIVVYLVRHAERGNDGTSDPPITPAGEDRARLLASMLRDAGVTHVHSTDYRRTRATAAPIAEALRLETSLYDARELSALAARLRAAPGRHLVVGHSDTTTALVRELGGDPGPPIADPEYHRLYVLTLGPQGTTTVRLRFGAPPASTSAPSSPGS
jgi:broad specificity phosphatase PhoE